MAGDVMKGLIPLCVALGIDNRDVYYLCFNEGEIVHKNSVKRCMEKYQTLLYYYYCKTLVEHRGDLYVAQTIITVDIICTHQP